MPFVRNKSATRVTDRTFFNYVSLNAELCRRREVRRFMEIGVRDGSHMADITCDYAVGIDPEFMLTSNVCNRKKGVFLYQTTSDQFFRDVDVAALLGGAVEFSFLDGMHLCEYLLRDFINTERVSTTSAQISIHDCIPVNFEMTERVYNSAGRKDQSTASWWTGDVWKVIAILKKHRSDLEITAIDVHPTGLIIVSRIDPTSTYLRDNYDRLCEEMLSMTSPEALQSYLDSLDRKQVADFLR